MIVEKPFIVISHLSDGDVEHCYETLSEARRQVAIAAGLNGWLGSSLYKYNIRGKNIRKTKVTYYGS